MALTPIPTGTDTQVNTYISVYPSVTALHDGGFVVTWSLMGEDSSDYSNIFGQRYAADGSPVGSEFRVNTYTPNQQLFPSATALKDGGFVVTWSSVGQDDGSDWGIFRQRCAADGSPVGSEFRVNTCTSGGQVSSCVTTLNDGGFVVT